MPGKKLYTCVRCAATFVWAPALSRHLHECSEDVQLDLILSSLNVAVRDPESCWLAPALRCPKITIEPGGAIQACHIVALVVHGEKPDGLFLCHWCDDRRCLNPDHLYYGTPSQNNIDAWRNRRRAMSDEQKIAMAEGLRASPKHKARMVEHNRALAEANKGDNHWTHRSPDEMARWKRAIAAGKERGDATCQTVQ